MNRKKNCFFILIMLCFLYFLSVTENVVYADSVSFDIDDDLSTKDRENFDNILKPVAKLYMLFKYAGSIIGMIAILFAGFSFMTAGNNNIKRDNAKNSMVYIIIGLIIIWSAPYIVNFILG